MPVVVRAFRAGFFTGAANASTYTITTAAAPEYALPPGVVQGDRVFVVIATDCTAAAHFTLPSGWNLLGTMGQQLGPTGTAPGSAVGYRRANIIWRDWDGFWSMPSLSIASSTVVGIEVFALTKDANEQFDTPSVSPSSDATAASPHTITVPSSMQLKAGGQIVGWTVFPSATTTSAPAFTQTGTTFGTIANSFVSAGTASGNDIQMVAYTAPVSATGGPAQVTHSMTIGTARTGGSWILHQGATMLPKQTSGQGFWSFAGVGSAARPVASAVVVDTNFTGADAAAWPSPWTGVAGTNDLLTNRGRQVTPATQWSDANARANVNIANVRAVGTLRMPGAVAGKSMRIDVRFNPATGNGYRIIVPGDYAGFQLMKVTNWAETPIQENFALTWSPDTDYKVAIEANGSTIRAKRWLASGTEPGTWDLSGADTAHTIGDVRLVTVTSLASAQTGLWDDAQVSNLDNVTPPPATVTIIPNQERGWFYYTETHAPAAAPTTYNALSLSTLQAERAAGRTIVFRYVILDQFLGTDTISQTFRDALAADLAATRSAGMKMVLRFAYENSGTMTPPYSADPPVARVLTHIQQLAPTLNANADVISAMQAGFIGMWGEWYYTDNFGDLGNVTAQNWADRKAVVDELLKLDSRIFILIRYVNVMRRLIDGDPTNTNYANRIGHHNDAFLAEAEDWGTYGEFPWNGYTTAQNRTWLANRNQSGRYPMGGETANVNPPRSLYATASAEMSQNRWNFLNPAYHPDVLSSWTQAERDDAAARLGYRLGISAVTASEVAGGVQVSFKITNTGWAAPFRSYPVRVVFVNGGTVVTRTLAVDTKTFVPGEVTVTETVAAPATGTHAIHLLIEDPSASLQNNALYAMRLAEATWDSTTGRNATGVSVTTTGAPAPAQASGAGSWSFSGAGSAATTKASSGAGTFAFVGAGSASAIRTANGGGTFVFVGTGSGATDRAAIGAGAWFFAGAGSGGIARQANGAGSWTYNGLGSVGSTRQAVGVGAFSYAGQGSGAADRAAAGTGSWSFAGAGGTTRVNPELSGLQDEFNVADPAKWVYVGSRVENGRLIVPSTTDYNDAHTVNDYSMTSGSVSVELVQAPVGVGTESDLETYFIAYRSATGPNGDAVTFSLLNGNLVPQYVVGGARTYLTSVPYNPTAHRWLKMAYTGSTVTFQASPDGSNWTTLSTATPPIDFSATKLMLGSGWYGTGGPVSDAIFDNLNTLSSDKAALGAGSWSFSGTGTAASPRLATGAASWSFVGGGFAASDRVAAGTGLVAWAGSGGAQSTKLASGAGGWSYAGTGSASAARAAVGAGSLAYAGTGAAATDRAGAGSGLLAWVGAGSAAVTRAAGGDGAVAWAGQGTAIAPVVGQTTALGFGHWGFAGVGSADRPSAVSGSGLLEWIGQGQGSKVNVANGGGTFEFSGTGIAAKPAIAGGFGNFIWIGVGSADAPREPEGAATYELWTGSAWVTRTVELWTGDEWIPAPAWERF